MKLLLCFHSIVFLLITFNLLLVINTIQLSQYKYRTPILETKQNHKGSQQYIDFSSDRIVPSEGTTYKKAIILGLDKDNLTNSMNRNKTTFSFKESDIKKEMVDINVRNTYTKKEIIENQLVNNLSDMIKDIIHSLYIKETNRTKALDSTFDSYRNRFNIILSEMIKQNEPIVLKEEKKNNNITRNFTIESKKNETMKQNIENKHPILNEKKDRVFNNIEADDSSIVSEILKKYKN